MTKRIITLTSTLIALKSQRISLILLGFSLFILVSCNPLESKQMRVAKQETSENVRFKLFPTENVWTFLKLDTSTGKIWQVQYSINDDNRGEVELNNNALVSDLDAENGRFTLYPTKNMFNFILLDQIEGKMWQVQCSIEEEKRVILPM